MKWRHYFGESSIPLILNQASKRSSNREARLLLQYTQYGISELVVDFKGAFEALMIFVGVDEPITAFSAD